MSQVPEIKVLDKQGNGVPNKLVFASISYVNGPLPFFYQNYRKGHLNKELIRPIPGVYHSDFLNPLSVGYEIFKPILTNSDGMVSFSNETLFSVYGAYGEYKITFRCDGIKAESNLIKVATSVKKIKFYLQPPSSVDIEKDEKLNPIIQILGENNVGI